MTGKVEGNGAGPVIPAVMIAGTHSGCGKTTVARGLMQALRSRGYCVQPFKVGPDFIDPSHHTMICGRVSRTLDPYMMGREGILTTFGTACTGADIAVIEGVMGLFDGIDGALEGSSAHVAEILAVPLLLVVDIRGMSGSAHALVKGFASYYPPVVPAGVIFNRVGSHRHRQLVEKGLTIPSYGWIMRHDALALPGRHLGLFMAGEVQVNDENVAIFEEECDIDRIISLARSCKIPVRPPGSSGSLYSGRVIASGRPRIGIARDEAFCFYYQDNIDRLRAAGADLVVFSPCRDHLPEVDALYLGGGYPELHAERLSDSPCTKEIRQAADEGMPVYAECGGLLYAGEDLAVTGQDGLRKEYRMCGLLPCSAEMTPRVQALGYCSGTSCGGPALLPRGMTVRGHEFHYSRIHPTGDGRCAIRLTRGAGISAGWDGIYVHETVGLYTHAYWTDAQAESFVKTAASYRRK